MIRSSLLACAIALAVAPSALAQSVERGEYLVNGIGGCNNCHTPRVPGGPAPNFERRLSGGFQTFDEPFFTVKGSNITPDRDTGIGAWSEQEIKRALTDGVRPSGVPLAMVMPSNTLRVLTQRDLAAMVAYLRSIPPIKNEVQPPTYKAAVQVPLQPGGEGPMTEADLNDPVKRGFYLASLAHCMNCHARRSETEPPDFKNNWGRGGR